MSSYTIWFSFLLSDLKANKMMITFLGKDKDRLFGDM